MDKRETPSGGSRVAPSKFNIKRVLLIAAALLIAGFIVFTALWSNGKIYPGTIVGGIDVGGMTVEQATAAFEQHMSTATGSVTVIADGETLVTMPSERYRNEGFDPHEQAEYVAKHTLAANHKGGLFYKLGAMFGAKHEFPVDSELVMLLNANEFDSAAIGRDLSAICRDRDVAAVNGSHRLVERIPAIHVTVGKAGLRYDAYAMSAEVERRMASGEFGDVDMADYARVVEPKQVDISALFKDTYVEAADAHFDTNDEGETTIVPEVTGVTFDLADAKSKLAAGKDFDIVLKYTEPQIKSEQLMSFDDLLAEATTTFENKANYDRANNVRLAAEAINGTILMPGEEFSYNNTVGERTAERGYKKASVYISSGTEDQLGGGICQTSSTLYMAVLRARLEVTMRKPHAYTVGYTPLGEDATVYWGSLDFKFRNNRDFPVKIVAWQEGYDISVQLWGTDVDGYRVEISCERHRYDPYETIEQENPDLEYGKTKQKVQGHPGASCTTYATVYDKDGNKVDYYKVADSSYKKLNRVLEVGTKGAPTAEPSVEPTPPPTETPVITPAPTPSEQPSTEPAPSSEPTPSSTDAPSGDAPTGPIDPVDDDDDFIPATTTP